ncbi:NUDIX domain-containing protein [uncultured Arthrobacter sp.]|uniref:NUDIX hydrolase n=1 Tax=uncultured Arthrobacter sp. TaxID=114050 RepID=UPI0025CF5636|nr:NUDIX domain-containing protein [uncultured Arthrobacter sp.]
MTHVLSIAALCLLDDAGRLLLVRKRGTALFMQPGGKLEPGESAAAAAVRELEEELGLAVPAARLRLLGRWYGPAANEPDTFIDAAVFLGPLEGTPVPAAEIEEIGWLDLAAAGSRTDLAPLLTEFVVPALGALPPPEVTAWQAPR